MPLSKGEQLTQTLLEYNNIKNISSKINSNRGSNLTNTLINTLNTSKQEPTNDSEKNPITRGMASVTNVVNQAIRGASKGLEGIYDFGANLIGSIGGLFGAKDFQEQVADHTKFNWTDWWYNKSAMPNQEQIAYTNDWVNGVAQSIGQMLPSIAIGVATGGTSTAAQAASLGTFGVGAAGNATETALNEGATINQALGYGLLSGVKEVGTELVGGKVLGKLLGSSGKVFGVVGGNRVANQATRTTGKELVKRFALDSLEEGTEEALGDLVEPIIQQVYKGDPNKNIIENYVELFGENGGFQAMINDFATGAFIGGIMGGTSTAIKINRAGYDNYKLMQDIEVLKKLKNDAKQEYFKGNNEAGDRILEERSRLIQEMTPDIARVLTRYQIANNYRKANITEGISQEVAIQAESNTRNKIILEGLRNDIANNIGTTQENYSYYDPNTGRIVLRERDLSDINKTKENLIHEYTHSVSNQNLIDTIINNMDTIDYQNKLSEYTQRYASAIRQSSEYRNLLEQGYSINDAFNQVAENYVREEIAADEMNKYFSNISEFKQAIKGSTKNGFTKLLNNIRALYRNKSKPSGYSEVVKLLQTNINRINKTAETKAKTKETKYKTEGNAIVDSEGNTLSSQQQEYFKDSKVRDDNGNLRAVYHGTDANFTVFDKEKSGNAFFFTSDKTNAQTYTNWDKNSKTLEVYLNITNPRIIDVRNEWNKIDLGKTKDVYLANTSSLIELIESDKITTLDQYLPILQEFEKITFDYEGSQRINDLLEQGKTKEEIFEEIYNKEAILNFLEEMEFDDTTLFDIGNFKEYSNKTIQQPDYSSTRDVVEETIKQGKYDGVIFKNIIDYGSNSLKQMQKYTEVYVAFEPNQIKSTTNTNPTTNEDIRYKLDNEIVTSNNIPSEIKANEITTPNVEESVVNSTTLEETLPDAQYVYDLRQKKEQMNAKTFWNNLKDNINRNWFNAQINVELRAANKLKLKNPKLSDKAARYEAEILVQRLRTAPKIAENLIERGLIDEKGNKILEGVDEIFKGLSPEDYIEFQDYMFHMHNIDRMSVVERIVPKRQEIIDKRKKDLEFNKQMLDAYEKTYQTLDNENIPEEDANKIKDLQTSIENLQKEIALRERTIKKIKNKPVFSEKHTAEYSRKFIEKQLQVKDYATKFPELAQKIYKINDYILEESVKSGRLSTQERDLFKEYYPHYVPTYRPLKPQSNSGATNTGNDLYTKSYKKARGSNEPLIALDLQLKRYIMQNIKANAFNDLGTVLLYGEYRQPNRIVWEEREDLLALEENLSNDTKPIVEESESNYSLSILSNGVKIKRNITREEFIGLQDLQKTFDILSPEQDVVFKVLGKAMKGFKSTVTSLNPFFLVRNLYRDVQDAFIYTKYGTTNFIKMSAKALKEMQARDTYFKLFRQYGGFSNSIFDSGESIYNSLEKSEMNKIKKKNPLKWLGNKMELANRAVEILPRYIEFRLSIEAQKKAGVENINYDKAIYDSQEITLNFGRHGASRAAKGLNRYLIPFFNAQIQGVSKIFKTFTNVDGKSVKAFTLLITKTALLGLIPAIVNQLLYDDDEDYANLSNYEKDNFYLFKVGDNFIKIPKGRVLALIGSFANNDNKKLNDYLSSAWDTLSPVSSLRTIADPIKDFTTNTTWYGGNIVSQAYDNVRPSNQYDNTTSYIARGIGKVLNISPLKVDYVLEQYTGVIGDFVLPILTPKGLSNPKTTLLEPTINQFLIDPNSSSGYSSKFYNLTQELNYQVNEDNLHAKAQLKYLNKMKSYINDIYNEIDALEESNLSNKEIETQTKILRGSINVLYKQSIETSEAIREELNRYEINEDNYDKVYEMALYSVLGAESTLKLTNVDLYDRATDLNEVGIDYDTYYTYYINTKGFDKEYKEEYIQRMNLTRIQKYILYLVSGYAIPDNYKARLRKEIKNSNMSNEYKEKLLAKLE